MPRFLLSGFLITLIYFSPLLLAAELQFTLQEESQHAATHDDQVEIIFPFEVVGDPSDPAVEITSITSDCACLSASTDQEDCTYEVGERGEIRAIFELDNATGSKTKSLTITTTGARETFHLASTVHIPQLIEFRPASLQWIVGRTEPMETEIHLTGDPAPQIQDIETTLENVELELEQITENNYILRIIPTAQTPTALGIIRVHFDHDHPRYQTRTIYALVSPAPSTSP